MAYVTQAEIEAAIPAPHLVDALDDDADGAADEGLLEQIIANAGGVVDGYLAGLFPVPFTTTVPAVVKSAALVLACELVYARRQVEGQKNPFAEQAKYWRERLQRIGAGELPLDAGQAKAFAPGAAITGAVGVDDSTL